MSTIDQLGSYPITIKRWEVHRGLGEKRLGRDVYVFSDILEGESKVDYFKRKGYADDRDYLAAVLKEIFRVVYWTAEYQDIVPEKYGGKPTWMTKMESGPIPGSFVLQPKQMIHDRTIFVPTTMEKREYYEQNPPNAEYLRKLIRIVLKRQHQNGSIDYIGGKNGVPYLDHIIPPGIILPEDEDDQVQEDEREDWTPTMYLDSWNLRDHYEENEARWERHVAERKIQEDKHEKARIRRNERAKERRVEKKRAKLGEE